MLAQFFFIYERSFFCLLAHAHIFFTFACAALFIGHFSFTNYK